MSDSIISMPIDYSIVIVLVIIKIGKFIWAHGSVVVSGTVLQADRSRVRFPMRSLDFQLT
jgi:hypothetical protein